ncbi:helix-turn-helix transcriptional regulator [Vagococcus fessus]|uniref:WYL domain-containing protein n=1 Tax=Vagococcus fessus TaxID=120370 RepID=A0A430A6B2_9ENTE|nr:WYL domain-containing protein [Vagococcus fessus]RSU02434.1 hypothetical protein CBF31_08680 [Vagococcus fessus]
MAKKGQERLLEILLRLMNGETLTVKELEKEFPCTKKTLQRDFNKITNLFSGQQTETDHNDHIQATLIHENNSYRLAHKNLLSTSDIIAILKILISTRSLSKNELQSLITTLSWRASAEEQKVIHQLINGELLGYQELSHKKDILPLLDYWIEAIINQTTIKAKYRTANNTLTELIGTPESILAGGSYFYIRIYTKHSEKVKNFRLDRFVSEITEANETLKIPQEKKLPPADLRNKNISMFTSAPGSLTGFKFKYWQSEEIILDTFPNATIIHPKNKDFIEVTVEQSPESSLFWILSQGGNIQVTEPHSFVEKIKTMIDEAKQRYN